MKSFYRVFAVFSCCTEMTWNKRLPGRQQLSSAVQYQDLGLMGWHVENVYEFQILRRSCFSQRLWRTAIFPQHLTQVATCYKNCLTSCSYTCVHGCQMCPGALAASPPGVRGWEWLWTGGYKIQQQGKMLPLGWEEWAPSPSPLLPLAHQAADTCEKGAWGTACLGHSCQQRETSLVTFISLTENMNVFFYIKARKTCTKYSCNPSIKGWHD